VDALQQKAVKGQGLKMKLEIQAFLSGEPKIQNDCKELSSEREGVENDRKDNFSHANMRFSGIL
jgi:hypothetical protein